MAETLEDIEKEVGRRLSSLGVGGAPNTDIFSSQYKQFEKEEKESHALKGFFEKYCKFAAQYMAFLKVKPEDKKRAQMQDNIDVCSFTVTPEEIINSALFTLAFAILAKHSCHKCNPFILYPVYYCPEELEY